MSAVRVQRFTSASGVEFDVHYDPKGRSRRSTDGVPFSQFKPVKIVNVDTEEVYEGDTLTQGAAELGRDKHGKLAAERTYDLAEVFVLTLYQDGHYILAPALQYPETGRGGSGQVNGYRRSPIGATVMVRREDEVMAMTDQSKLIRTAVTNLQVGHRTSFGGVFMHVDAEERIVSASAIAPQFV